MKEQNSYFSHDGNARNDSKVLRLRMRHGAAGYGVYFMILERLREEDGYVSVKDYNMIAFDLRVDASLIKSVVEDFGLFAFTEDGECFYSESFNRRMAVKDNKSEVRRKAANAKWGKEEKTPAKEEKTPAKMTAGEKRSERLSEARRKGTHTEEEWNEMKDFFGECVICGSKEHIAKDHIIPIYQGGSDAITNLQPLCRSCNSRKGSDNHDYRIDFCERKNLEMPAKWVEMPAKWVETPAIKIKENKRKDIEKKESKEKVSPRNVFHAPTLSEVEAYIEEKQLVHVSAERFIAYYESNGWMVGRNKMKSWKAALSMWEARDKNQPVTTQQRGVTVQREPTVIMPSAEDEAHERKQKEEAERKRVLGIYEGAKQGNKRMRAIVAAWAENGTLAEYGLERL